MGQKAALNLWYFASIPGQILKNCSRAFGGLSYLAYKIQKTNNVYFYFFLYIIQIALFSSEFFTVLPTIGKYSLLKSDN